MEQPDPLRAIRQRIALSTQKDVIQGMFIENSLILVASLKSQAVADEQREKILSGKSLVSFFRYPVSDLLKLMEFAIADSRDPATMLEDFGAQAVRIFFNSPVGKTMLLLASSSPHRLLASAPAGFKAASSFGDRVYSKETDNAGVMETTGDLLGLSWQIGVFQEALKTACNVKVKIDLLKADDNAMNHSMRVSW